VWDYRRPRVLLIKAGGEKPACVTWQTAERLIERGGVLHGDSELDRIEVSFAQSSYGYAEEMDAFLVGPLAVWQPHTFRTRTTISMA